MKPWFKYERIPGLLASSYEKASRMVIEGYYSQVADEIVANIQRGSILDLGTGPGYLPIQIVKRAPDVEVIGIDLSRKLIHMATDNARKAGCSSKLSFEVGNSAGLRFKNASFDMVISTGMLHSLKKPVAVLKEIYRVLKNGGEAWIFDPANISRYIDRRAWKETLNLQERFYLWIFGLLGLHRPIVTYRRDEVLPMISATKFQDYWIDEKDAEIRIKLKK